jgi:hypothetical protein
MPQQQIVIPLLLKYIFTILVSRPNSSTLNEQKQFKKHNFRPALSRMHDLHRRACVAF